MRVIWISGSLFAVFLVALFVFSEPQPEQTTLTSAENKTAVENPFVEDASINTADSQHVELAVLPGMPSDSEASRNKTAGTANIKPVVANKPVDQPDKSTNIAVSNPVSSTPSTAVTELSASTTALPASTTALPASTTKQPVVAEQTESEKASKKVGLAMIMLEKERQKNKVAVIVHESNAQEITEKEIKALYLDRLTRWRDGSRVMLFNLPLGDKYRDKFSKAVLKMTALEADREEEKRRELHIKANDVEVKSKNVVVSYVEQYPNAIAYVPLNLVRDKSNVKVILTIP